MASTTLTVGLIVVSTTAFKKESTDTTTDLLHNFFDSSSSGSVLWKFSESIIVPDEAQAIKDAVIGFTDFKGYNLVVTTGGTGFAVTDITPETVKPLLSKEAPGLVHAMLSTSLKITPFAMMSRPIAGVRSSSVIITVPGSPKGAKENLEAVIALLSHACQQSADLLPSRKIHAGGTRALEEAAGVTAPSQAPPPSHHHHHGGCSGHTAPRAHTTYEHRPNSLTAPVTKRHRSSPYPTISVAEAHDIIAAQTPSPTSVFADVNPSLVGSVLATGVFAPESVPSYRASIVDGYAIHHTSGAGRYPVVSVSHATPGSIPPLLPGQIARVTTGAPVPDGATAVVMVEDTVLYSTTDDGAEEKEVEILPGDMAEGENIRLPGSDVMVGDLVLKKGTPITASGGEIGILASVGKREVLVYRRPTVGVLSTGDEVVPHTRREVLKIGEIRDSNRPSLLTAVAAAGFEVQDLGIAKDAPGDLESTLREALEKVDVVITTGGVSMGEMDFMKPTIVEKLNGIIHFGRVKMKPGKPTTFATVATKDPEGVKKKKLVFSLPGNPASALVTFHLFVLPSLRRAAGYADRSHLPRVVAVAGEDFRLDERPEFHRVRAAMGEDGRLVARSTGGQRSSRIGSAVGANGVLELPGRGEVGEKRWGKGVWPKGEMVKVMLWGPIGGVGEV
ncbi:hypothetical protein RUND412_006216 [Rhizina undulata]